LALLLLSLDARSVPAVWDANKSVLRMKYRSITVRKSEYEN
jgi:hypothetical protein